MELHLHSHRWETRAPDWAAAAVAGFAAGAVLMVLELFWSTFGNASPWTISNRIAAIAMGPGVLQSAGGDDFSITLVGIALATHYVLGIAFGVILAAIIAPFHLDSSNGMALLAGAVFGLVLYLFNFYGMVRFFPWFAEMRGWAAVAAHLIFGMAAAVMYRQLEKRNRL